MKYLLVISLFILTGCSSNLKTINGVDSEKHKAIWSAGYDSGVTTGWDQHKKYISKGDGIVCYPKPMKLIGIAKL